MQSIYLEDRKKLIVKGATKIVSSTTSQAVVELSDTTIVISGNNLEITNLNLENHEVSFAGTVNSIKYTQKAEKKSLLKKLFK